MQFSSQLLTRAVNILIAVCVLMFFFEQQARGGFTDVLALHYPKNDNYGVWQYISHMFMHGSIAHLLFNMFALYMFGSTLENVIGRIRFLIFYFACGIGAALIYNGVNHYQLSQYYTLLTDSGLSSADITMMIKQSSYPPSVLSSAQATEMFGLIYTPMVGASGAIYGVLVAFALFFPNNKLMLIFIPYPIAAKFFVPALLALDLFSGVTGFSLFGGAVAHSAHIGGAIIGFLLILIWRKEFTSR